MDQLRRYIDELPSLPGVYYFYRDDTLLYVGKSVDIKARVLSHCYAAKSSAKERKLVESANRVTCQTTPGEMGALLLESREIKLRQPLYNRRLRRKVNVLSWHLRLDIDRSIALVPHVWPPEKGYIQFGLYRNRYQALNDWKNLTRDYGLCEKKMDLVSDKGRGPCFAHQLGRCRGACLGIESIVVHDERLKNALHEKAPLAWPYDGPVAIVEVDEYGASHYYVVEKWRMYGSAGSLQEASKLLRKTLSNSKTNNTDCLLDMDEYRIVLSFLRKHKHSDSIQKIE